MNPFTLAEELFPPRSVPLLFLMQTPQTPAQLREKPEELV